MNPHSGRRNRVGLAITGLALLIAGAYALVRGLDLRPEVFGAPHAPVVDASTRAFANRNIWFLWIPLAVVLFLLVLLGLYWLAGQARTRTLRDIRLETDPRQGATWLSARALTHALQHDLGDSPYVRRATARFTGDPADPRLSLTVTLEPDADPAAAKDSIGVALDRLHQALEVEGLPSVVHLR
jgi:hypothetical protein